VIKMKANITKKINANLREQIIKEFIKRAESLIKDINNDEYKKEIKNLVERSAAVYLKYAQLKHLGKPIPEKLQELLRLYEAELNQYEAIASLKLSKRLEQAASIAIEIVVAAITKGLIASIVL